MATNRFLIVIHSRSSGVLSLGGGFCKSTALNYMHSLSKMLDPRDVYLICVHDVQARSTIDSISWEVRQ